MVEKERNYERKINIVHCTTCQVECSASGNSNIASAFVSNLREYYLYKPQRLAAHLRHLAAPLTCIS